MRKTIPLLLLLLATLGAAAQESFRPSGLHFSPPRGWMNDPNGMVYLDGEYHLFYQHHPDSLVWAPMHWGHAVSRDLVTWEHLPVALFPDEEGMIFSGSCVIDRDNTAGFGPGAMVAIYTAAKNSPQGDTQAQAIAYSTDRGRTFRKYNGGRPVLTDPCPDFRDPKVFWHEAGRQWVMSLAVQQEIRFYTSPNLREWTHTGSFGYGYGNHHGVWECPDLFLLNGKWVLLVNINPGGIWGGSATQYFVGHFDGKTFTADSPIGATQWMDYGKDHYATVTWDNAPDGRRIAITWMNNWEYATRVPATEFRSTMSVPCELTLQPHPMGGHRLMSQPVAEVTALRRPVKSLEKMGKGAYEIELTTVPPASGLSTFTLSNGQGEQVTFTYDFRTREFTMDRTRSGLTDFAPSFAAITKASFDRADEPQRVRILVDRQSMEIFDSAGQFCMTNLVFPTHPYTRVAADSNMTYKLYKLNDR